MKDKGGLSYNRATDRWELMDWSGNVILVMDDGDVFHILDNMTDEDRARAAIGWLLMVSAEDDESGLFWAVSDYLVRSRRGGYSELPE